MRIPLSWLSDYVDVDVDARDEFAVRELSNALDGLGLVVESVERIGEGLDGVVVAQVRAIHAIEGADKIRRVEVDAGGAGLRTVVCGAWNFSVGDVVPLATVGTVLPGGMEIARRKLRGIVSEGMLCSGGELGLDADGAGILVLAKGGTDDAGPVLPDGVVLGRPLAEHLGIEADVVFDLAIEPNRPDCLCVTGVARDLAARLGRRFSLPDPVVAESGPPASDLASVRSLDPGLCPSLGARVLTGVRVLPSSGRIARRLALAGMRPLNSVVDASNYVMLELGRPNHPYDLDRLGGAGIVARAAARGEALTTLDGTARRLGVALDALGEEIDVLDGVICDAEDRPVGLAGVMGGADSEITDDTSTVLLEIARFDPVAVARSAKRHGLRSEASVRFERGVDPAATRRAADRFAELLVEAAVEAGVEPPRVAPGLLLDEPEPFVARRLTLRVGRVNDLLGTSLDPEAVAGLLEPIGFQVSPGPAAGTLVVEVPGFRPDVEREIDLVEEVARHLGYERIAARERRSPRVGRLSAPQHERRALRRLILGLGANEAFTSPIVDPGRHDLVRHGAPPLVRLANPMAREESALRAHLLPGLLGALRHNVGHRNASVRLFEIGHVFAPPPGDVGLPDEHDHLGVLLADDGDDATDAMAAWRALEEGLRLNPGRVTLRQPAREGEPLAAGLHPSRSALVLEREPLAPGVTSPVVGALGEVAPDELERHGLGGRRVGWLVVDLDRLLSLERRPDAAAPVSRYPSSDVDLAFVLSETVAAGELEAVLLAAGGPLCESVRLIDVYRGPSVPAGARSLTWRVRFCAPDHTLEEAELAALRTACIDTAEGRVGASLRR